MNKIPKIAFASLAFNLIFSAYHIVMGVITFSWWLFTLGIYYFILGTVRFVVICVKKREHILTRITGWMLIALSLPLVGTVILSLVRDRGQKFHMIVMIAIATYAFTKITLATIKLIKSRHSKSPKTVTLRNISFADAFVSIFSLQRSMLVSFEGMTQDGILIMNALTGAGVCIIVFLLGLNLVKKKKFLFKTLDK
ncbi:MAG: hypothetical protein E7490_07240 [Ruminococcaceae bacterium]|nr:hypothetical protein [Oscillospiraceae bacterium]